MPRTKSKPSHKAKSKSVAVPAGAVLTLSEVAAYLRVPASKVEHLVREYHLPGREIGKDWRFLRAAVDDWLKGLPGSGDFWATQAGAFKDDPDLDEIVREAYRRRGRPITDAEQPEREAG
jgi:excisionase family DNA binding protein